MRLPLSIWFRLGLLFLLGLLLFLGIALRRQSVAVPPGLEPLPQDPVIQVYFNHSQTASYTDPYRQRQRPGDDLEAQIVEVIRSAQTSIDLAAHELNLPGIAQALRDRHQAGVKVRVITENTYSSPLSELTPTEIKQMNERERKKYDEFFQLVDIDRNGQLSAAEIAENDAMVVLQAAQIPVIDDTADGSKGSNLMHHKFVVIDGHTVIVGSANFTLSDIHGDYASPESQGNANHLLKITNPALANLFTQEFNVMWGDGPGGRADSQFGVQKPYRSPQTVRLDANSTVTLQFSPTSTRLPWEQSANGLIGKVLSQATRSVDLMLFVFSEQKLSDVLETNHQRGLQIRALIDPGFAYRDYSDVHYDKWCMKVVWG